MFNTPPFFSYSYPPLRHLHSFPTRRSSDLPLSTAPIKFKFAMVPSHDTFPLRSEEYTSEIQSPMYSVCLLLTFTDTANMTGPPLKLFPPPTPSVAPAATLNIPPSVPPVFNS